jgi:hypothetical protein
LTKHINDDPYKSPLNIEDPRLEVVPKIMENSMVVGSHVVRKPKAPKMKVEMVKSKIPVKRTSRIEKATATLYDLEDAHEPEKPLNIDFGLYQMEEY